MPPTFEVNYGVGNKLTRTPGEYRTLGDVLSNPNLAAEAGWPIGGVEALVDGVKRSSDHVLVGGESISVVTKAQSKAS